MRDVKSTYGGFMSKSERFNKGLEMLDVRESAGHLGDLQFTTGRSIDEEMFRHYRSRPNTHSGRRILHASRMQFGQFVPMRLKAQTATFTI